MGNIYYLSSAEIIIFLTNMDFHQQDIRQFLLEWIPLKFDQLSPPEFADFIRYLFEVDGYDLLPTEPSGEFSGVVRVQKEDLQLAIIPTQINPEGLETKDIILKAVQARTFFEADQAWVITTGTLDPDIRQQAEEEDIEMWDWDALYEALCQLFFEGQSHLEYLEKHPLQHVTMDRATELRLKVKWQAVEGVGTEWFNLGLTITNPSERNVYLHLELPALIDLNRNQVMAEEWVQGEFVAGLIYAGASVRTNALFSAARLGDRPPGGRIMLTCHERLDVPVTYHLQARLQGQACFVVTYCYSTQSPEYSVMTAFRDQVLSTHLAGRIFIRMYYALSPVLVSWASRNRSVDKILRRMASGIMPWLMRYAHGRIIQLNPQKVI